MASTRVRKAFRYPADNSDEDDEPIELDEEEQEKLIAKLRYENEERNDQYMRFFLAIPTTSVMTFFPAILTSRSLQAKFVSILAITSLLSTAYMLVFISNRRSQDHKRKRPMRYLEPETGPVHRYLGYLNAGLSLLLSLYAIGFRGRKGVHDGFWILCLLPGLVFCIVVIARRVMLSVDVSELEGLKYGYKGA
ncbi:MAG: hypothetical protein LQ347_004717 [Umbilicaria vellea]|nr:MAG: hypothetical protein LQ347_004717 [Umbilicaria vellea]